MIDSIRRANNEDISCFEKYLYKFFIFIEFIFLFLYKLSYNRTWLFVPSDPMIKKRILLSNWSRQSWLVSFSEKPAIVLQVVRRGYSSEKYLYQLSTVPISKKIYPSLRESLNLLKNTTSKHKNQHDLEIFKRNKKSFENDQSKFINTHFTGISNALNFLVSSPETLERGSRYDYPALLEYQLKVIISKTTSQNELMHIFDSLMAAGKLTRPVLIPLLLNSCLVDRQSINKILINVLVASSTHNEIPQNDRVKSMSTNCPGKLDQSDLKTLDGLRKLRQKNFLFLKCDFICLQVALTQKFFMLKEISFVNELINLNFQSSWMPYIINCCRNKDEELLPEAIERSIFRIFYIFIRDEHYLEKEIIPNLGNRSYFLLLEAMPLKYIKEKSPLKLKEFIIKMTESLADLTDLQLLYLDLLRLNVSNHGKFNSLKLISIESKLSNAQNFHYKVLRDLENDIHRTNKSSTNNIIHLKNPFSLLLSSAMKPEEEKILVKAKIRLTNDQSNLLKIYKFLIDSIGSFIIKECSYMPANQLHEIKAVLDAMKLKFRKLSSRLGAEC